MKSPLFISHQVDTEQQHHDLSNVVLVYQMEVQLRAQNLLNDQLY